MSRYFTYRRSRPGDEDDLKSLWKEVFHDPDAFIESYFRLIYRPGMAAVCLDGNSIISAAHAIPMENALYIYAVATLPRYRGRGCGREVTLLAAGGRPAYLYPAEDSLRKWYKNAMGARPASSLSLPDTAAQCGERISAEEYFTEREKVLAYKPHAVYSAGAISLLACYAGFYRMEGRMYCVSDGRVKEMLPPAEGGREYMLGINNAEPLYWGPALD